MTTQSRLLRERRFLPLFVTQFLGALNDNVLKNGLVVLLIFQAGGWTTWRPELLANLAAGVFVLPFLLFSASAGQLADKFDKARIARAVKLLEIGIVLVVATGFALHSLAWLLTSLFLLGLHSTLFGPVKYAILPQHLRSEELLAGNALVEAGTFVAILLGTVLGGLLAGIGAGAITGAALLLAIAGYLSSRRIPAAPAPVPDLPLAANAFVETWRNLRMAREDRLVFATLLAISWFWLYGAVFLTQFPAYTKNLLGGDESAVSMLLATFTLGVGAGALLCRRLSGDRIEPAIVPLGAAGLTVFGLDLALASPTVAASSPAVGAMAVLAQPDNWRILVDLVLLGLAGGLFSVPLYALMQQRSQEDRRARVVAANNILNALFMTFGAIAATALLTSGLDIPGLFAALSAGNAVAALMLFRAAPEFPRRLRPWLRERFRR